MNPNATAAGIDALTANRTAGLYATEALNPSGTSGGKAVCGGGPSEAATGMACSGLAGDTAI